MRLEIVSAADFLVQLLRLQTAASQLSESQLQMFKKSLTDLLGNRYRDHWFPDRPNRGSGYRCIRINGKIDPIIAQAGLSVGLVPTLLRSLFPKELTMWIDPAEVSYRIGENGSICVLFEGTVQPPSPPQSPPQQQQQQQHQQQQPASPTPTPTSPNNMLEQHRYHYQPQQHVQPNYHHQQHHHYHHSHHHQMQQQFESCKDSLLLEHTQFNEQLAAYVSS